MMVNARFNFVPLQTRFFLTLLSRVQLDDVEFKEQVIPVSELVFERHGCQLTNEQTRYAMTSPPLSLTSSYCMTPRVSTGGGLSMTTSL